jgi:hypothetical protein
MPVANVGNPIGAAPDIAGRFIDNMSQMPIFGRWTVG